jgi:hypothetical protein
MRKIEVVNQEYIDARLREMVARAGGPLKLQAALDNWREVEVERLPDRYVFKLGEKTWEYPLEGL